MKEKILRIGGIIVSFLIIGFGYIVDNIYLGMFGTCVFLLFAFGKTEDFTK